MPFSGNLKYEFVPSVKEIIFDHLDLTRVGPVFVVLITPVVLLTPIAYCPQIRFIVMFDKLLLNVDKLPFFL